MNYLDDFLNSAVLDRPARDSGKPRDRPTAKTPETPGHWWRPLLTCKSVRDRERWGRRANELAESGAKFPEDERRAYIEVFGRPERLPFVAPPPEGLDAAGWALDGLTWTAAGFEDVRFDPPALDAAPAPRERIEPEDADAPRPYVGRAHKPTVVLESVDPAAAARKVVGEWAEVGREFMESAPRGKTPDHVAGLYRLGAGMLSRAIREAIDSGLDGATVAGLRLEHAEAARLGSGA